FTSMATTRLLPVSLMAFRWRGAIYPAAPINAKFFIFILNVYSLASSLDDVFCRGTIFAPAVDQHVCMTLEQLMIECAMVCGQYHGIEAANVFCCHWLTAQLEVVFSHFREYGHMRIAVRDDAAFGFNELHQLDRGGLTHVIHVLLIGNAQYQNAAALQGFTIFIEAIH